MPSPADKTDEVQQTTTGPIWSGAEAGALRLLRDKEHSGAMVALMLEPSDAAALLSAVPPQLTPEPADNLHVTLAYLGKAADLTRQQCADVDTVLASIGSMVGPLTGVVGGMGYFNQDPEGLRVLYASCDAPELPELQQLVVGMLQAYGVPVDETHGFTPHITLAYVPNSEQPIVPELPVLNITFPALTRMFGGARADFQMAPPLASKEFHGESLSVLKQADGSARWVLVSSNSFEDRDREVVSQGALEADVARADRDKDYGPLLWWHLNGKVSRDGEQLPTVKLGDCDFNAMHGRMLIESGTFVSPAVARAVDAVKEGLEVSLGFNFPETALDGEGVIHEIRRTERSLLPRGRASNPLTAVPLVQKESTMLKEKYEALRKVLGGDEALIGQVLQLADTAEKEATAAGVRTKAKAEVEPEDKPNGTDAEAAKPFPKALATDSEKPEDEADEDEAKKEFDALRAEHAALVSANKELRAAVTELVARLDTLATASAEKEAREKDTRDLAQKAFEGVQELKGELPRKLGDPLATFRPSQKGKDVSAEAAAAVQKQFDPDANDPLAKHMAAIFPGAAQRPPGM